MRIGRKATASQPGTESRYRVLARGPVGEVDTACGCGRVVRIHVGPVTLRFDREGLAALHQTLGNALATLARERHDTELALDVN